MNLNKSAVIIFAYNRSVCVDGYKFVITKFPKSVSMVQFFYSGSPVGKDIIPAKCG